MSRIFRIACVCGLNVLLAAAAIGDQGTATGTITLGGKTVALTHAYALARTDTFDKTKQNTLIVLSDAAIPADALWEDFPGLKMAAAGKLHAVEVELNPDHSVKSAALFDQSFVDTEGFYGIENPDFRVKTFDASTVEGKLSSAKPQQLMNRKFEFSGTFRAPILHRPAPSAVGAAAAQTAPGKVVTAFLKAVAAGDRGAIRKLLTAEYGKPLDGPQAKVILETWKMNRPDPATSKIGTVDIRGNSADVVVIDPSKSPDVAAKFSLVLEAGQWRIDSVMM